MPIYKDDTKKKNKYWFEFDVEKDLLTGKRKRIRRKGFKTEPEAKKAMAKFMNDYYEGNYIEPSKMNFSDYMTNTWLPVKKIGKQTKEMYKSYINKHIKDSIIDLQISKITTTDIQNFIITLENKGLANNSVKKIYSILHTSFNDAITMEIINKNPASKVINKPKEIQTEKEVWNQNQIRKFVEESDGKSRYSLVYRLTIMSGLRQGEVLGLRWKDVDFTDNTIKITQTLSHDGKELKSGAKNKRSVRKVKIDPKTMIKLQKHSEKIEDEKKLMKKNYKNLDLVFCTMLGTPCSPRNLLRTFYSLMENIDVPKLTFHELRHTQATLLLSKNVNPKIVSERLGHSSIRITMDTYSHMLPDMQDIAVESLADVL